jgi:PAS domain S-box-containing protein
MSHARERLSFLAGGGEMGALMRAYDWGSTPIGPPETWPQSLRTTVRLLLTTNHPMFIWWGPELIQFYNDAYRRTLGPERHPSALGQRGRECWDEIWDVIEPQIDLVMRGGGATWHVDQLVPLTRHGAWQQAWWTYGYSPIHDERDGVGGVLAVCNDVTDQHLAAEALRESEERLRRLNETLEARVAESLREREQIWKLSRDLLAVANFDGQFIAANPAWTSVLGMEVEDVLRQPFMELIHPEDRATADIVMARLAAGEATSGFEARARHTDGSYRWISWSSVPEGGAIYAVGRDVTAEHEAADALRQAEDALRQAQKMEAVGQLTGGIAHDFNNMLQGMIGSLDLIRKRVEAGRTADIGRFLDAAMASAERAAALTHRLLAFSRRQPLDPRPLDCNPLITSMVDMLHRTLGEQVELKLSPASDAWPTLCDRNQLESAIVNLVINARDAMPGGGELTISTRNAHLEAVGDNLAGDYVCLSVADTGCGMPANVAARAFDPFFTTKPIGRGTGLGLSMIYGFVRQSGGRVEIDSREGAGTTVRLYLPRHAGQMDEATAESVVEPHEADAGEVVLVVEDDQVVRELIVEELGELGYRTLQADDGPAGLELLRANGRIDLLVTDIGLPGLNGLQVASAGRETRAGLKVLFMTGYAQNALGGDVALETGMELITKPFAMGALAARVRTIIEGGRPEGLGAGANEKRPD